MMPTTKGMSHVVPHHVLRVGQTIRLDAGQEAVTKPGGDHGDPDLDISLDNLNQLILELDPTFEPIQVSGSPSCLSPPTDGSCSDEDVPGPCVLVPRGCPPGPSPATSPSIPIPRPALGSPACSLPPLPCGSVPRRNPSPKPDAAFSQGSLRLSHSNRNSAASLHSMSTCSDTSYILGSTLSLASEDADSPESLMAAGTPGSLCDVSGARPPPARHGHLQEPHGQRAQSSPASLSGSLTDIPVLLVNGAPDLGLGSHLPSPGPENQFSKPFSPHGFHSCFTGSQPSMKFVMDTSKYWFRPHVSRAEAEALIKDREAGAFVVRDSTSYRGSFGLAMKVEQSPTTLTASAYPGESSSELIRHFLIESSAKGVRIKGSSQEPYFGSLSALVYQHTISAYALPCRLLLHSQDLDTADERGNDKSASEEKSQTACNFIYLNAVPTETLTGPYAVQKAVTSTFEKVPGSFIPTVVNLKASLKGVTLTDINRKLFFRRHYPAHLLSYSGEDPDNRLWTKGGTSGARMFGFVAKGVEAGMENVCHVFAEYDTLQPCNKAIEVIQAALAKL